jgi:hypothetical protein
VWIVDNAAYGLISDHIPRVSLSPDRTASWGSASLTGENDGLSTACAVVIHTPVLRADINDAEVICRCESARPTL